MNRFARKPWIGAKQGPDRARNERGQALAEFAIALPVLLTILVAVMVLGIVFNNELELTYATDAGGQYLSISRGQTTDPCATASSTIESAAPNLKSGNLAFTLALGPKGSQTSFSGTSCTSANSNLVAGNVATVTATYPCNLVIFGKNYAPSGCSLSAQTTALIQ